MRTLNAILESALANQQGELILRVNTWTDAADYAANPATPDHVWTCKAFSIESTTASAELVTENDYTLSAFTVFTIERGVRLSGVDYTIESGLMHVRKYTEDYGAIKITGSSYPNQKINIAAGDGTYQEVIEAFCTDIGKTAVFKNATDTWLDYQFLPTGKALSLNKAELFENLLKQKYCILVYEESPNNLVFYNQDSYQSSALNALTENAGALLAVATAGANGGMTSVTGADWIPQILPSFYNDVTYAAGLYVAVGASVCATSADGITWTARTIPAGTYTSLTHGNSLFVAVGTNVCATSADAITWTSVTQDGFWEAGTNLSAAFGRHTASLLSDGRILIAGGYNNVNSLDTTYFGTISGNTITWAAGTALSAARHNHTATILPDGRILITGGFQDATTKAETYFGTISGNTITWAAGTALSEALSNHTACLLSDGRILITGGRATGGTIRKLTYFGTISGNTITWAAGTDLSAVTYWHTCTTLSDGRILITGGADATTTPLNTTYFGTISGNTITWAAGTALSAARYAHTTTLLANDRIFIVAGYNAGYKAETYFGTISGNTITWAAGTNLPNVRNEHTATVLPDTRILIAGGYNSSLLNTVYILGFTPQSLTTNNSIFLIVGLGSCATSTNGTTWTQRTIPAGTYYGATYGNSLFIAVGASVCATSTDGTTWTSRTIPTGTYYGVTYGNSLFIAVGASVVATSTDGTTWTARTPAALNTWRDVIYSSTLALFIAVASDGASRTMTSADGIAWTASTANADFDLSYLDGPTSYLDRQQSEVHFIWRDEAATIHTSGDTSLPQWNLGFLASTDSPPTTRADAYYKIFLQKAPVRLDITDGDRVHFSPYWSIDPTQTIDAMMQISEHLNLRASPAWYQEIRSIVLFDKTEGGALPSTIERVAAYTPLVSTGFDGNLTPAVNNLQALAQAVDDLTFQFGSFYAEDIALTIVVTAADVYYPVTASMTAGLLNGITFANNSQLVITKPGKYLAVWSMSLSAGNNDHLEGAIMVNSTQQLNTVNSGHTPGPGDEIAVSGTGILDLAVSDIVRLCVENEADADDIIVHSANLSLVRIGT